MEREACWNCLHDSHGQGDTGTGAPCPGQCRCPTPGFPWHLYRRYGRFGEVMPHFCGHYQPRDAGRCPACGAPLGTSQQIQHWACGVFAVLPCCSPECLATLQRLLDAECDAIAPPPPRPGDRQSQALH